MARSLEVVDAAACYWMQEQLTTLDKGTTAIFGCETLHTQLLFTKNWSTTKYEHKWTYK